MKLILSYLCTLTFSVVTDGFGHSKTATVVSLVPLSKQKNKYILLLQSNNQCGKNVSWGQLFELFLEAETAAYMLLYCNECQMRKWYLSKEEIFTEKSTGDIFLTDTHNKVK